MGKEYSSTPCFPPGVRMYAHLDFSCIFSFPWFFDPLSFNIYGVKLIEKYNLKGLEFICYTQSKFSFLSTKVQIPIQFLILNFLLLTGTTTHCFQSRALENIVRFHLLMRLN